MTNSDAEGERRKMLLIFPITFYSFADGILKALSAGGYDAVLANHEYPSGMLGKILGNLKFFRMLSFITERVLYRDYIAGKRYDLVLIVKGRGVSRKLIEKLRHVTPRKSSHIILIPLATILARFVGTSMSINIALSTIWTHKTTQYLWSNCFRQCR